MPGLLSVFGDSCGIYVWVLKEAYRSGGNYRLLLHASHGLVNDS